MAKFSEIAAELRILAEALDKQPDAKTSAAWITFYCYEKEEFLVTARTLPRPLKKKLEYGKVKVQCAGLTAIDVTASIDQDKSCEIIEPARPAVYRCEPILADDEEAMEVEG